MGAVVGDSWALGRIGLRHRPNPSPPAQCRFDIDREQSGPVFLVFVLVGSALTVPVGPGAATHDHREYISATTSIAHEEGGGWVVLATDLDRDGGWIYEYSSDWEEREDHRLLLDGNEQFQPFGIERARDGGWCVIDQEGSLRDGKRELRQL